MKNKLFTLALFLLIISACKQNNSNIEKKNNSETIETKFVEKKTKPIESKKASIDTKFCQTDLIKISYAENIGILIDDTLLSLNPIKITDIEGYESLKKMDSFRNNPIEFHYKDFEKKVFTPSPIDAQVRPEIELKIKGYLKIGTKTYEALLIPGRFRFNEWNKTYGNYGSSTGFHSVYYWTKE